MLATEANELAPIGQIDLAAKVAVANGITVFHHQGDITPTAAAD